MSGINNLPKLTGRLNKKTLSLFFFLRHEFKEMSIGPETERANHEQTCVSMVEPVSVAKDLDDLWLGVKGQSSSGIAGFLRNLFG